MLALAVEAQHRGHDPVVCAPPDFADDAERLGIAFESIGGRSDELLERRNDLKMHVEQVRTQVTELVEAAAGADLVVGTGVPLAGPTAAASRGCPYRYVGLAPEFVNSDDNVPPLFPIKRLPRPGRIAVNAAFDALWMLLYEPPLNRARRELGLPARRGTSLEPFSGSPPMVLACDEALGPAPANPKVPFVQTAAIQLESGGGLSDEVTRFLDRHDSAIYLGFGSMPSHALSQPLALASAIHESTDLPVLVRGGTSAEAMPEWCLPIGDEPHQHLFPRCAAVVHHGGAGTLTTAARNGVPQVVVPHLADQFYWAHRVEELGIGARVRGQARSVKPVALAVARVSGSSAIHETARELAASIVVRDGAALTLDALMPGDTVGQTAS